MKHLVTIDDLITDTIPTRLGYHPSNALAIAVLNRDTLVTGLMLIDLADTTEPATRHATIERAIQITSDLAGRSLVLVAYTQADPAQHRPVIDAITATLTEHVTVATYYLHAGTILDDDLQAHRPAPLHPILTARPTTTPNEDDLTTATTALATTAQPAALDTYLELVAAALDGTYPDTATPARIGAALALMTNLTGRDAALVALFDADTARALIADTATSIAPLLASIISPEATPTPYTNLSAYAVVLWDMHAHTTDPAHAALILGILATLALASAHIPTARTLAAEAVREVGATHRAARLAMLVMTAADVNMTPSGTK